MPKTRQNPKIETRFATADYIQIGELAAGRNITRSELVREAVRWYLHNYEKLKNESRESAYVIELKSMTNRLAALLVRVGTEVGTLYELQYRFTDPKVFEEAINTTKSRLRKKLVQDERNMAHLASKIIRPEPTQTQESISTNA